MAMLASIRASTTDCWFGLTGALKEAITKIETS